jgi:uncharacterized membrane protein YuzA (DUF378 family)
MKRPFFFYSGVLLIIIFLLTGQYMQHAHNRLIDLADGPRMIFRANHIYLLIIALVHILFSYVSIEPKTHVQIWIIRIIQAMLIGIPILILIGFFVEPFMTELHRPYTRPALYMIIGCAGLLVLYEFIQRFTKTD